MKIREVLSPTAGLFTSMPQDVWGDDLDPVHLDIELFTRIGGLEGSPLFRHFVVDDVLDTVGLAELLHQRYASNWKHVWSALKADYDVFITSMTDETRTVTRDKSDTETRALKDSLSDSGTDLQTDTFNESTAFDSTQTKTGAEKRSVVEDESRNGGSTDTGTVNTGVDSTSTDSGTTTLATGIAGVGGGGQMTPQGEETTTEGRDTLGNTDTLESRDLAGTTQETRDASTEDRLEFENRKDVAEDMSRHTGTVEHATTFGKKTTADKTGTVGTVGNELEKETFHSEGSSPLRTFQALIQEELDGRSGQSWNFTELVIRDVQAMIGSMIWRRNRG